MPAWDDLGFWVVQIDRVGGDPAGGAGSMDIRTNLLQRERTGDMDDLVGSPAVLDDRMETASFSSLGGGASSVVDAPPTQLMSVSEGTGRRDHSAASVWWPHGRVDNC